MEIKISNISKSFGDNPVLKGINLQTQSGKALGLLGRNGAGKTTIIRIIMGLFPQNEGEILIDGAPIDRSRVKIGYLPEERGLYPKKPIVDQLIYFGLLKGLNRKQAMQSCDYWLERLQMSCHKKQRLDTLSKGNQQKIQLAAALLADPDIVILDEPFSGLDPVNATLLKDVVKELIAKNKLVLFSSHQMNYIEEFCEDIAILNKGEIVLSGNIEQIKRSYDRSKIIIKSSDAPAIKDFLSESSVLENGALTVHLHSCHDKSEFMKRLVAQGFDLDEISVYQPSLNDIFVQYTEDRI
ncbi:MAG: ATP-binding cassette domain-containing protein [Oscillospiraceae bacterium]